ncbi:sensor domain-containing diguanylate cyclase [Corallincola luteus]|uniref:diguanylate cyclase n=1 Tax=Corallincola luteus TaxID=1775177 RepID=A0ABY2AMB4_9GAMM|nr:sensor domain-containing diguanylate cyclase [Corallincola luteus]TCI02698.1 sensor domain-containing diguanylate cyclase [Corallincola luteus]
MPFTKDPLQPTLQRILAPYFWPILIVILVLLSSVSGYNYLYQRASITEQHKHSLEESMTSKLAFTEQVLVNSFQHIEDSVRLLAKSDKLIEYIENPTLENKFYVEKQWALLAQASGNYRHLKLVDIDGYEKIRIDYDSEINQAQPANELINKSQHNFMMLANNVNEDETALIVFDLEKQNNQIRAPYRLMGRTLSPVVISGERKGYVVLNLKMDTIASLFDAQLNTLKIPLEVVAESGHFIRSKEPSHQYGHMISERNKYNLNQSHPTLWRTVSQHQLGIEEIDGDLFAFRWVQLGTDTRILSPDSDQILLLSRISEADILAATQAQILTINQAWIGRGIFIFITSLMLAFVMRYLLTQYKVQKLMLTAMCQMSSVMLMDTKGKVIGVNHAFEGMTGYNVDDICGYKPSMLFVEGLSRAKLEEAINNALTENGFWHGEVSCKLPDQSISSLWMEVSAIRLRSKYTKYYVASFVDITERTKREQELVSLSTQDPLTGISNRRQFDVTLTQLEKTARRYPSASFCLALLDLDYFKQVNDVYGHTTGDNVLKSFAKLITSQLREQDIFARIGGEEFAIIMPFTSIQEATSVCERLRLSTTQLTLDPQITVSIGIANYQAKLSANELYERADKALYQAKALGRNRVRFEDITAAKKRSKLPSPSFDIGM